MRMCDYEGRPDWKQIVEREPCEDCSAPSGSACRNTSFIPGTLYANQPRNDWHQNRKEKALLAFIAREQGKEISLLEQIERDLHTNRVLGGVMTQKKD